MELLKLRKLHFSRCMSSAIFTWSSKLMADRDMWDPCSLHLVRARFLNFLVRKLSHEFKLCGLSILHKFQMAIFPYSPSAILACSSKLMVDYDSMGPSLQQFGARFLNFSPVCSHVTLKFAKRWHHQNSLRFISALAEARSLWLWLQVGRNKPCMLAAMTVSPLVRVCLDSWMSWQSRECLWFVVRRLLSRAVLCWESLTCARISHVHSASATHSHSPVHTPGHVTVHTAAGHVTTRTQWQTYNSRSSTGVKQCLHQSLCVCMMQHDDTDVLSVERTVKAKFHYATEQRKEGGRVR